MKKFIVLMILSVLSLSCFAQDTTSVSINYIGGEGITDFVSSNWQALAFLVFAIVEYYLGKSKLIESNSVIQLLFDVIKKLFSKK